MSLEEEEVYVVEFLVKRRVRVKAHSDVGAEIQAFRTLKASDRVAIEKSRVCFADGTPVVKPEECGGETWFTPDMKWLRAHRFDKLHSDNLIV